jgi:hypothetical protein
MRMSERARNLGSVLLLAMAPMACSRAMHVPDGYNVSSESSDYSPAVSLALSMKDLLIRDDSIIVAIDSGRISAPGSKGNVSSAVMSDLYMTAILATTNTDSSSVARVKAPWVALALSDSLPVATSLPLGEQRPLHRLRFALARPASFHSTKTWLAFRITGSTVSSPIRLADGTVLPESGRRANIRVYACSDWMVDGHVDKGRKRLLATAYGAGC